MSLAHILHDHALLQRNDSAHSTLFHPLSGAGGSGPLDAMRMGQFKAHWTTGGATDCGGKHSRVVHHATPLLFDLHADPAEAHALDTSTKAFAAVVQRMSTMRQTKLDQIHSQPRSTVDYKSGPAGRKINCCDESHVACRCTN